MLSPEQEGLKTWLCPTESALFVRYNRLLESFVHNTSLNEIINLSGKEFSEVIDKWEGLFFHKLLFAVKRVDPLKALQHCLPFSDPDVTSIFYIESLALGCLEMVASNDNQDSPQIDKGPGRAVLLRHFFTY